MKRNRIMQFFVSTFIASLTLFQINLIQGQTTRIQNGSACINGPSFQYDGTQNVTRSGQACLQWNLAPSNFSFSVPLDGGNHNYCRNPTHDANGIWCYTSFANRTRKYCFLPKCETDARVIWTAYNAVNRSTHLFALNADHEWIRQNLSPRRTISVEHYFNSTGVRSEIWSLTSDYDSRRIFFVDYRAEYIGVHSFNTSETFVYHDGLGHGIESLAYDKFSQNLYWSDSTLKWVMASDSTFTYYTIVFRTDPDPAYGLAIHTTKRFLFFSSFRNLKTKIWRTDMAGRNATVILQYPKVDDVTGLAIDYNEDRIYWTDFVGTGSKISSAFLDGSNKTDIYFSRSSIYWNLGIYLNYVYVTDIRTRFTRDGRRRYYIFIINKITKQLHNYGVTSRPRGITIFQKINATSRPSDYPPGECSASSPCQQMCLPSLVGRRRCACGLGYYLSSETNCSTVPVSNEAIIFADSGQGKIYHLPLSSGIRANYSIIPVASSLPIATVAVNIPQRFLYWSVPENASVMRSTFDGGNTTRILSGYQAKTMAIDQQTGYIYFSDNELERIYVMDMNGQFLKTLYKPTPRRVNISSISSLALDLKNKFIYWTDSNGALNKGELRRMRFNGAGDTVVFTNLSRPSGLSIDLDSDKLYLGEGTIPAVLAFPLDNLTRISNEVVNRNTSTFYDLRSSFRRSSSFLADVKVWNRRAYIYDSGNRSIEMFDLERGTTSVGMFGPREFFRIQAISIYSQSYYNSFLATQRNPCGTAGACGQLCLATNKHFFSCECQDGWSSSVSNICTRRNTASVDYAPLAFSCEADKTITLEPCQNTTVVSWDTPTWVDDITETINLNLTRPALSSPATLSIGRHDFRYTATDVSGNVGVCSFSFVLRNLDCGPRPYVQTDLNIHETPPACSYDRTTGYYGSYVYFLTCGSGEQISFGSFSNSTLANQCLPSGSWRYSNFYGIVCGPPRTYPYPSPTTTTTSVSTNTTPYYGSTIRSTASSTARSTTQPITRSINGSTSKSSKPTVTKTVSPLNTTKGKDETYIEKRTNQIHHLSPGGIAGIVITVLLLVVVIAAVLYLRNKNVNRSLSFLLFWKKKEIRGSSQENIFDDINHYTVL